MITSRYDEMMSVDFRWSNWGQRFRAHCRQRQLRLSAIAEKMGRHESTLRSWLNGNREVNLSEFVTLCQAAGANPAEIFCGQVVLTDEQSNRVKELARGILADTTTPELGRSKLERRPRQSDKGRRHVK